MRFIKSQIYAHGQQKKLIQVEISQKNAKDKQTIADAEHKYINAKYEKEKKTIVKIILFLYNCLQTP